MHLLFKAWMDTCQIQQTFFHSYQNYKASEFSNFLVIFWNLYEPLSTCSIIFPQMPFLARWQTVSTAVMYWKEKYAAAAPLQDCS